MNAWGPRIMRLGACGGLLLGLLLSFQLVSAQQAAPGSQPTSSVARLSVRITSPATAHTVSGVVSAVDASGRAINDLSPEALQASVDAKPVQLSLRPGRPSIALAAAFLLDSSASPQVRDAVANALAEGVQGIDVNRDTVAIASTADDRRWDQSTFTTTADDLKQSLNQIIRTTPDDSLATLEQVSGVLRVLSAQARDAHALLLFTNRPLASAVSMNASLGTIRNFASDNGIQVSVVALPGAGGLSPAEVLAGATPGGRVEYVLNATNRQDISRRGSQLLSPVFGAHRFEFPTSGEGTHTLSVGAPGVTLQATATFQVAARAVQIDSLQTNSGQLKAGDQISEPTWVEPTPSEVFVPPDFWRSVRNAMRNWGLTALLLIGESVVLILFPARVADGAQHD